MDAWQFLPMQTPYRFAINGEAFPDLQSLLGKPVTQCSLKGGVIEATKHAMEGGYTGATLPLQP
jgi:hypothetical protein